MANTEHLAILMEGAPAWNEWRRTNPEVRPDLSDANLAWLNLHGVDLHGSDLANAKLRRCDLTDANLRSANLDKADLRGARLGRCCLAGTDLTVADLDGATVDDVDWGDCRLLWAQLGGLEGHVDRNALVLAHMDVDYSGIDELIDEPEPEPSEPERIEPNPEHLAMIRKGVAAWNDWREENPELRPQLIGASLSGRNLEYVNLSGADLGGADLSFCQLDEADFKEANLIGSNLEGARLRNAFFREARFSGANLLRADAQGADFGWAKFFDDNLHQAVLAYAKFNGAEMSRVNLGKAVLAGADLTGANLNSANLRGANLMGANLTRATLGRTQFIGANLQEATLNLTLMVGTDFTQADLTSASVYGIAAWDVKLDEALQSRLLITGYGEPPLRVDDLEMAQFIHMLMSREKLRNVITTMGEKAVLILGRFTERKELLDRMADRLRELGFLPMIFDFERPTDRDLTETVKVLAGLSRFVIADITNPRSVPLELQATLPDYMVPFVIIVEKGQPVFGMFDDLPRKHDWALPLLEYSSVDKLIAAFDEAIVSPALAKGDEVRRKKAAAPLRRSI